MKLLLIVLIGLSSGLIVNGFIIDEIIDVPKDAICAALAAEQIAKCSLVFEQEIQESNGQGIETLKTRKMCCAFNHLRDCVIDGIEDKCGSEVSKVTNTLVTSSVSLVKTVAVNGDCDPYKGKAGTVLCLPDFALILIVIGLVVLAFISCGCVLKMCCGSSRPSSGFIPLVQTNGQHNRPILSKRY